MPNGVPFNQLESSSRLLDAVDDMPPGLRFVSLEIETRKIDDRFLPELEKIEAEVMGHGKKSRRDLI